MLDAKSECSWAKRIAVDERDQLMHATKEQIVAHNLKFDKFCR